MFGKNKANDPFFMAFTRHADVSVRAAAILRELFEHPDRAAELAQKIKDAEHEGDKITHDTIARLRSQWITPLDRGDIHNLIAQLDDVLDVIEAIAERVVLFQIQEVSPIAMEAVGALESAVGAMRNAVMLLPNSGTKSKEILELCVEVNSWENKADQLFRAAIAELFTPGRDPMFVMKWREIYDKLESATDVCEDVANTLEGVVMEYA
jgi:predicted phosphate transport protein (TIGR00153 family)